MKNTLFFTLLSLYFVPVQAADIDELYNFFSDRNIGEQLINGNWNSEGLDIYPSEIPVSCDGDSRVMELNKIRVLYALFYTDNVLENDSLQEFDVNKITTSEWNEALFIALNVIRTERLNFELMIETLIEYHDKITHTQGWEKKLNSFISKNQGSDPFYNYGEGFYSIGFSKDACFSDSNIAAYTGDTDNDRLYVDINVNLEIAIYSFWYRRYVDGSMDSIYRFLSNIIISKRMMEMKESRVN